MKRMGRWRRWAKWAGVGASTVILSAWVVSYFYFFIVPLPGDIHIVSSAGRVEFSRSKQRLFVLKGATIELVDSDHRDLGFVWPSVLASSRAFHATIPYWLFLAFSAGMPALLLRLTRKKIRPGHCRECGYDLRTMTDGRCPECGTAAIVEPVKS